MLWSAQKRTSLLKVIRIVLLDMKSKLSKKATKINVWKKLKVKLYLTAAKIYPSPGP